MTVPIHPSPNSSAGQAAKQVIYVDVDDEITTIIDKMNSSKARVVALVLPKRAAVFQSVVNMKLLKRRAETAKKNIVLITSELSLMPLAGLAGLHVASTLQSRPEIPAASSALGDGQQDDEEETATLNDDFDQQQNAAVPIGALAGAAASGSAAAVAGAGPADIDEGIAMDSSSKLSRLAKPSAAPAAGMTSKKLLNAAKDKNPRVPNFLRFRKRFILAGLAAVVLGAGWYYAYFVAPTATITIKTNTSDVDGRLAVTLDTAATTLDDKALLLPAQTKQEPKSNTQSVPATGQANKGLKATGEVVMSATICGTPSTPAEVPAGTGISVKDQTFITQKTASFSFTGIGGGCIRFKSDDVTISAQKGGTTYNVSSADFTVAGRSDVTANGSTTGGTDAIVKVVQQADVDAATQKLSSNQSEAAVKKQLQDGLEQDGLYALPATFFSSTPNVNLSTQVGDEADTVTVTQAMTYTMFGVKQSDLRKLIDSDLAKKINTAKQDILDNGLDRARITTASPSAGPQQKVDIVVTASAGPKLNVDKLKADIKGLKSGEVESRIKATPGVDSAQASYSPFWVTKAPKASKISVQFEKSSAGSADDK